MQMLSSTNKLPLEIRAYYDVHVKDKIRNFIDGNERVERAWLTIEEWAPGAPQRVLEIGCGIGDICWRMSRRWPEAQVIGVDISSGSLEIARQLFGSPGLSFMEGPVAKGYPSGSFDLVVLMDVYEHIALFDRSALHEALRELRGGAGRLILSFPTPRHLLWLRQQHPEQIQPVDEDVTPDTVMTLARDTRTELMLYQEVGVWHQGDYAHAVLGEHGGWKPVSRPDARRGRLSERIVSVLRKDHAQPLVPPRAQRLALVRKRLDLSHDC